MMSQSHELISYYKVLYLQFLNKWALFLRNVIALI